MNIFETVKQSVTTRQAAERYGIRVERNGMCRCPFHDDSTPSMKLDRRYYCFGCGATGDVIDFVSQLRGIGSKEAAILLAQDFAIPYEDSAGKTNRPRQQNTDEQNYQHMERYCSRVLCGDIQARASVVIEYGEEVRKIEQRMAELAAADEAAAQNAGRQHGTADER